MVEYCFKYHSISKRMVFYKDIKFVNKFWETIHKLFGTTVFTPGLITQKRLGTRNKPIHLDQLLRVYTDNDN